MSLKKLTELSAFCADYKMYYQNITKNHLETLYQAPSGLWRYPPYLRCYRNHFLMAMMFL